MQVAAHDAGRSSRAIGGYAGAAVAAFGALLLLASWGLAPASGLGSGRAATIAAAALTMAGLALVLLTSTHPNTGPNGLDPDPDPAQPDPAQPEPAQPEPAHLEPAHLEPGRPNRGLSYAACRTGGRTLAALAAVTGMAAVADDPAVVWSPAAAVALLALAAGSALAGRRRPPTPSESSGRQPRPAGVGPAAPDAGPSADPAPPDPGPGTRAADLADRPELALLQSMNEAVMVLDTNYRVLDVNRRWRELTGHRTEDAVGRQPPYPWAPDAGDGDRLLQHVDGSDVPVLATLAAVPDADGRPRGYVATYVDIGDRKRAEEALAQRAAELEGSNSRLLDANSRLEAALAFKNDLMSMLSHDMAQPVSSIASLAELLTSDWADLPDDIRLELATKIDRNTSRLIRMMNDLSLLFRLDAGSVTAQRTPVPVREVVETVASSLGSDGIEIAVDGDMSALADRAHLSHIVRNLLTNAVSYGSAPIEVRARQEADRVVLIVQDQGAGIPAELVPHLFDRFMRGSGLGLFIVRHLCEANGGAVRYELAEPRGARLIVDLEAGGMAAGP